MPLITFIALCIEIAVLIKFGQAFGGVPVLLEILLSGALGILFLRKAGRSVFEPGRLIELLTRRPTRDLLQALGLLFFGGLLLLIPGLLSDIVGFVLVVRFFLQGGGRVSEQRSEDPETIDVEFRVHEDDSRS